MNNLPPESTQQEKHRKRNALAISLITGIIFTLVAVILGPIAYKADGISGLWGIGLAVTVSLSAFAGAFLISRQRVSLGIGILITTILLMALVLLPVVRGQGLMLGVMVLILVAGISSATLPSKWVTRAIVSALCIAMIIIIADLYLPEFGLSVIPSNYTNPIVVISCFVYIFMILRRFSTYTLRTKIIISFTVITIIPLLALSFFNSRSSTQALKAQGATQLTSLANIVADAVDQFINTQLDSVYADSKQLSLITYLEMPSSSRKGSEEEINARQTLLTLARKNPVFIHSVALLDANGKDVLDTFDENQGKIESNFSYFTTPMLTGLPFVSNNIFRDDNASIYFSSPIKAKNGDTVGILRVAYYATVIQSILRSIDPGSQGTLTALVDANTYLRAGYTGKNRDELFKSYKNFTEQELAALQASNRVPSGPKENAIAEPDTETIVGLDNLQQQPFFTSYSEELGSDSINTGVFLETQPWIALVRQATNVYLIPIKEQNKTNTLISLFLIGLSVAAGYITSQFLTSPLTKLTDVADKITAGDLTARAQVTADDEIGILATTFNRMTDQLNQTLLGLEQRVAERTTDLELSRQQSIKRANELQSIGEISKIITSEKKLETLLPLITHLVSESFNFYHTGIFLIDNTNQFAVLQAANSSGGKNMLERGHKLEVGGSGIVGYVAQSGLPRISLDVGQDAVFFNNPDLPNTRSEMALPLKLYDRTVGVLDVQSEKPGAFTENDAKTLSILADQIAIALENARLFAQTQQALEEAQALYRQNVQEGWKTFSREKELVGYQQGLTSGKKLTELVKTDEIQQAMNLGEVLVFHADGVTEGASIIVPIKLRGQVIGNMRIKAPTKNRQWSSDEIALTETISERLSVALENARLFDETTRRAEREHLVSDITTKIRSTNDPQEMIKTAVEELKRALGATRVEIVPQKIAPPSEK
jgi:GAF domain-containing protein/HAMP domain-containing protein